MAAEPLGREAVGKPAPRRFGRAGELALGHPMERADPAVEVARIDPERLVRSEILERFAMRLANPHTAEEMQWRDKRAAFEGMWGSLFTPRWSMPYDHFDPVRVFTAMFLHGGVGHLLGNMFIFVILGLALEGASAAALVKQMRAAQQEG